MKIIENHDSNGCVQHHRQLLLLQHACPCLLAEIESTSFHQNAVSTPNHQQHLAACSPLGSLEMKVARHLWYAICVKGHCKAGPRKLEGSMVDQRHLQYSTILYVQIITLLLINHHHWSLHAINQSLAYILSYPSMAPADWTVFLCAGHFNFSREFVPFFF